MSRETVTNILSHGDPIILQGEVLKIQTLTFRILVPFGGSAGASGGPPGGGASQSDMTATWKIYSKLPPTSFVLNCQF